MKLDLEYYETQILSHWLEYLEDGKESIEVLKTLLEELILKIQKKQFDSFFKNKSSRKHTLTYGEWSLLCFLINCLPLSEVQAAEVLLIEKIKKCWR